MQNIHKGLIRLNDDLIRALTLAFPAHIMVSNMFLSFVCGACANFPRRLFTATPWWSSSVVITTKRFERVDVAGIRLWEKGLTMLFYGVIYGWVKVMQKMWKIVVVGKRHPLVPNVRNDYLLPQHNWSENESILIVPGSRLLGCALQRGVCLRTEFTTTIITPSTEWEIVVGSIHHPFRKRLAPLV